MQRGITPSANPPYAMDSRSRWPLARISQRAGDCAADIPPPVPYTAADGKHHMTIFIKIFTTRTLLQIIFVLAVTLMMKAISAHYDFSWATALAAG